MNPCGAIQLTGKEIKREDDKWVLAQDPDIEVVRVARRSTLSRWKDALSYGIDLAGGTNLVYELDESQAGGEHRQQPDGSHGGGRHEAHQSGRDEGNRRSPRRPDPHRSHSSRRRSGGRRRNQGADDPPGNAGILDRRQRTRPCRHHPRGQGDTGDRRRRGRTRSSQNGGTIAPDTDAQGREIPNTEFDGNPEIAVRQMAGKPKGFKEILILYEPDRDKQITGKLLKRANPTRDSQRRSGRRLPLQPGGGIPVSRADVAEQAAKGRLAPATGGAAQ